MDEEYFEQEFEDELEALKDLEMEEIASTAGTKRSLFIKSTQNSKVVSSLNDSFPTELGHSPDRLPDKKRRINSSDLPVDTSSVHTETKKRRISSSVGVLDEELESSGQSFPLNTTSPKKKNSPSYSELRDNERTSTSTIQVTPRESSTKPCRVLKRIPRGEYMPVTATDGARSGYMTVTNQISEAAANAKHVRTSASRDLLGIDFQTLKRQVEERRAKEALDALERMKEISANLNSSDLFAAAVNEDDNPQVEGQNHRLWVDLYSPKLYIDLMSDEAVNRVLLRWVKMWDYVVFKKQKPINRKSNALSSQPKFGGGSGGGMARGGKDTSIAAKQQSYKEFMKRKYEDLDLQEEYDALFRPTQKVVLLCGKPGLGKTTLAHVIARHAGYNVIEMNASDERTAQSFRNKIEDSLTMQPLLGAADPRPNCLIIDEIDGAPAPAINALLSKITDTASGASEHGKKKKPQASAILRPIICICNDLYTPALRSLRQHALVLNFPSQCPSRLATRLLEICRYEGLYTDMSTLMALCRRSSSDIRSCLNTLQFIRRRRSDLTMKDLMSLSIGSKDEQKSLFTFWQQVFQIPSMSRTSVMPSIYSDEPVETSDADDNSISGRFDRIYREAQACGEFNRLVQGLHENFPNMKYKDCLMRSINNGMEWLCFTDQVNKQIMSQQAYILTSYLHYLSVVFHLHFSQSSPPKITYPKAQYEVFTKRNHMSSLITTLCHSIPPNVYQFINPDVLTMDVLPIFVDTIIQPNMRPVNIQLYSAAEKAVLKEMVSSMIAYNLTYTQHKNTDGVYAYTLEPPVDELIKFPDIKQTRKALSYTAKQLIGNEVEQEKQRRLDRKSSALNAVPPSTPNTKGSNSTNQGTPETTSSRTPTSSTPSSRARTSLQDMVTPNHKQKLVPKSITPSHRGMTDFFGRPVDKSAKILSSEAIEALKDTALLHTDIWYKFKEGFSNAVRKKVTINDLL